MAVSHGGSKAIVFAAVAALLYIVSHHAANSPQAFVGGWQPAQKRVVDVGRRGIDIALKMRIKSVKETGRVTDAMRVVAAARVRQAQANADASRPFSDELQGMIKGLAKKLEGSGLEKELPMLKVNPDIKNVGLVVVCADKGLCGAFNAFVWKKALARSQALNEAGIEPKLIAVGKKSPQYCKQKLDASGVKYSLVKTILIEKGGASKANEIGEEAKNLFLSGEVDKIEIIYSKFVNLLLSQPTVRTLLPLTPQGIEDPEDETFRITSEDGKLKAVKEKVPATKAKEIESDVLFDQSPEVILNSMLPLYVNSLILAILYDSSASELAARMTAMKAATDNAEEVGKKLNLLYNRKRQAFITAELCDIVGGCAALDEAAGSEGPSPDDDKNDEDMAEEFETFLDTGVLEDRPDTDAEVDRLVAAGLPDYAGVPQSEQAKLQGYSPPVYTGYAKNAGMKR